MKTHTELSSPQRLKNRVAIVTGSSAGIGAAVAEAYAAEGAQVVINHSRDIAGAEAVASRIEAGGGKAIVVKADVSKSHEVQRMVELTHEAFGSVDVLVNNAGIYPRHWGESLAEKKWRHVMDVNLTGYFLCARAVSEDMKRAGYGKIINVSSIVFVSGIGLLHYGTSKAGIVGLSRSLAGVLGPNNICVNTLLIGAIKVEREKELDTEEERAKTNEWAIKNQCLKRRAEPADVVGAFIFFASHESDWITGHCLAVDGGCTKY